ncbi:MAG TPA: hypothetical protein VLC98_14650 [Phnomibacter sp.]|nr:hypothetical protein [Phnomibacter sp.]
MSNFTPEQLIAYHYNELTLSERERLQSEMETNWPLLEKYRVIQDAAKSLDKALTSPRNQTVQTIVDYGMAELDETATVE